MYAFKKDNNWVVYTNQKLPLSEGSDPTDLYHVPPQWTDEEKQNKFGIYVVVEDEVPAGKYVVSHNIVDVDGIPFKEVVLEDIPSQPFTTVENLSDRQLFSSLAENKIITETQALKAVKNGTSPKIVEDYILSLPKEKQFEARMYFEGSIVFGYQDQIISDFFKASGIEDKKEIIWKTALGIS